MEMLGPTVRDVMTFGHETFPRAQREWPHVRMKAGDIYPQWREMEAWFNDNHIHHRDWFRRHETFYFTHESDALLFKMRWK